MSHLIEIRCTWLLKKTLVISINLKILLMVKALKYSMKFFVSRMILLMNVDRSNRPEVFCKKGILRNLAKLTGKHLYQSHSNFIKKRLWCRCFPVNFVKFLRTTFFIKHLWCLLLYCVEWYIKSNYIEFTLGHGCPPVNLLHIFRTPFLKNTSENIQNYLRT